MPDQPLSALVTEEEAEDLELGDPLWLVGWGRQTDLDSEEEKVSAIKAQGETTLLDMNELELTPDWTTGELTKCSGDSGGPTFWTGPDGSLRQVGVTSYRASWPCLGVPHVDTRIDAYLDWVDDNLRDACDDGRRAWCSELPEERGILPSDWAREPERTCLCSSTGSGHGWWLLIIPWLRLRRP